MGPISMVNLPPSPWYDPAALLQSATIASDASVLKVTV